MKFKGRVSRFGACASDDVGAVKLIVFGSIRSEYTTPAGYGGQVLELAGMNKIDRPMFQSRFRKKRKDCPCKTHMGFLQRFVQISHDIQEMPELMRTHTVLF